MMLIMVFALNAPRVQAETITETQINTQREVVVTQLVATMQEQVKLLQMILIRHLEARVAELQARQ